MSEKLGRLDQAVAEAEEIERDPDRVVRADVKVTRGHGRTRTLQVRLNDDELDAIEGIADKRGLPVSTVARDLLLRAATHEKEPVSFRGAVVEAITLLESVRDAKVIDAPIPNRRQDDDRADDYLLDSDSTSRRARA